jgi:hypothetical protein
MDRFSFCEIQYTPHQEAFPVWGVDLSFVSVSLLWDKLEDSETEGVDE